MRAPTSERSAAVGGARTRHETLRLVDGSVQSSYSQVVCTFRAASRPVMITGNVLPIVEDVRRGVGQRGRSCIRGPVRHLNLDPDIRLGFPSDWRPIRRRMGVGWVQERRSKGVGRAAFPTPILTVTRTRWLPPSLAALVFINIARIICCNFIY